MFVFFSKNVYLKQRESFDGISSSILTRGAMTQVAQNNAQLNSQPCMIKMSNGKTFDFKVNDKQMPWFSVQDQPNSCALDLSSDEIANIAFNCSTGNSILNDAGTPNSVVKSIYWNDLPDNPKCEITFKDNPSAENMETYWEKQASYIKEANCQQAFADVKELTSQTSQLRSSIADSAARKATQEQLMQTKTTALKTLTDAIDDLNRDKSKLQGELLGIQNQLKEADQRLKDATSERDTQQTALNTMTHGYELQLGADTQKKADMAIAQLQALKDQHENSLKERQSLLDAKDAELTLRTQNAISLKGELDKVTIDLTQANADNAYKQSQLDTKNNTAQSLKSQIPPPPPPSPNDRITSPNCIINKCIDSANKQYHACQQNDGHFVVYNKNWRPIYATGKYAGDTVPGSLCMQHDGNLVNYKGNNTPDLANWPGYGPVDMRSSQHYWASGTSDHGYHLKPYSAIMQNDGNFVIYDRNEKPIWATNTVGK